MIPIRKMLKSKNYPRRTGGIFKNRIRALLYYEISYPFVAADERKTLFLFFEMETNTVY